MLGENFVRKNIIYFLKKFKNAERSLYRSLLIFDQHVCCWFSLEVRCHVKFALIHTLFFVFLQFQSDSEMAFLVS